ncbi:cytidine deaminase [Leptinotarsa decemlineata]|uniref:cytidine deaminase n=1 Tax=Leptinotarsa decemlineata TaxID=7539 RepID=UPI003D30B96A
MTSTKNVTGNIIKLKNLDANIQKLIHEAVEARTFAYCPYSKFKVGASVLCEDGTLYRGCNIENACYNVGICAERCAYSKALSEGKTKYQAVVVVAQQEDRFTPPCGACRQFMSEFGNVDVYITKPGYEDVLVTSLNELLPFQFEFTNNQG